MNIQIINKSNNLLPAYQTEGAAGMDICAFLSQDIIIKPLERTLIPTGLYIALPNGIEAQIRPRSGLAIKQGITCLNTPGTIDSDYRGEIKIILINLSNEIQTIKNGDRIAQIIFAAYNKINWNEVLILDDTDRGTNGFGSTGS